MPFSKPDRNGALRTPFNTSAAAVAPIRPSRKQNPLCRINSLFGGYREVPLLDRSRGKDIDRAYQKTFLASLWIIHGVITLFPIDGNLNAVVCDSSAGIVIENNLYPFRF